MNSKTYAFLLLFLPAPLLANPVVYTDQQHLPSNLTPETQIVWLDAPERLQRAVFGEFSASMEQATGQAQAVMRSPQWQQHENDLQTAYRGVVHAWEIGVRKYPAVVFDDRDVVYGTADVAKALAYKMQEGGRP
ncbi:TIGR03757 family integrating conjugative element protein [Pectobacterium versatile]|uniref:TIGR03757 family integrating conjugative element protein n=2 Tax=Pectobacterium TaxID=122277 RepID=A0AAW3SSQ8_9GAMM|nr:MULTISPECIES: TIGR03757 family integrating conjugative element protein [Pectobacterium]MBA5204754.1 TIGR03757 family integrating conjugative element protein [Pectobacterium aroidearum]MBN3170975.1 TIGR03757 family integrating conjugative element protein [Pectobacterium brasiliense]MBN3176386.1 TIGR03757 family integrating conjugative element protein [Pectobacterium parmentieri]MBQ4790886.1 TIGR03757 family integrating conjugative element protein [Pectobacterium versatile]QHQ23420.1 TIGR0375